MKPGTRTRAPGRAQPRSQAAPDDDDLGLAGSIRAALEKYLKGRRLVRVQFRQVEGIESMGFLKIEGGKGERLLVDFRATSTPQGGLSSLEVGERKIVVDAAGAIFGVKGHRRRS